MFYIFYKYLKKYFLLLIILIILFIGFHNDLDVTHYVYSDIEIPDAFDGYKIVQISDYHCKLINGSNNKLISAIKSYNPDIIVITGDMIDSDHSDISAVESLLKGISDIAPIYAVSGNHEFDLGAQYDKLLNLYNKYGVIDLDDSKVVITKDNSHITLYGLSANKMDVIYNPKALPETEVGTFSILLYHYTNHFDYFTDNRFNLILAGHTHGGIIRIPFVGGLIGNNSTFFPKYDSGRFVHDQTTMISSRGIGDASIPRFFNHSELVCITLHSK
ncbi:metallophosphoesterase [Anaerosporobacter sp.]